jgi:hypothetical protein
MRRSRRSERSSAATRSKLLMGSVCLRVMMRNCRLFLFFAQHDAHFSRFDFFLLIAMKYALLCAFVPVDIKNARQDAHF